MERLQNLKCLDTHFWAVELIVWVVFLVLFNTVSDRQSAVVHVVYCFMMSAGRIIDAGTEFLSGFIIDRTHTKIGKARPWILGTSFFVALPVFMVFNLLGQISQLVVGAYGVPILMYFGGYETGYRGMSFIFCFLGFLLPFLTGIICKEDPDMFDAAAEMLHESTKRPSTLVKTQIKYVFSSKYSFPLFAMFLLFNFAAMIFNSIAVHFIRDVLGNALYGIGLAFYGSLHNLLSPCLLKDADMQSFLWSVAFC